MVDPMVWDGLINSAELSRGSTCKWFRLVMVFSREKKSRT